MELNNILFTLNSNLIIPNNKVATRDLALCVNFMLVPDSEVVVMTVTVMKNKAKKTGMPPENFARVMSIIEDGLTTAGEEYYETDHKEPHEKFYFKNVRDQLSNAWYKNLCCHRVFFLPEGALFNVIKHTFDQSSVYTMTNNGLSEIVAYASTNSYDFTMKFY